MLLCILLGLLLPWEVILLLLGVVVADHHWVPELVGGVIDGWVAWQLELVDRLLLLLILRLIVEWWNCRVGVVCKLSVCQWRKQVVSAVGVVTDVINYLIVVTLALICSSGDWVIAIKIW